MPPWGWQSSEYWTWPAARGEASLVQSRWTMPSASGPSISNSPMWLMSKRPTARRTARCSSTMPVYWTGISQPPEGTIRAPALTWTSRSGVRLSGVIAVVSVMEWARTPPILIEGVTRCNAGLPRPRRRFARSIGRRTASAGRPIFAFHPFTRLCEADPEGRRRRCSSRLRWRRGLSSLVRRGDHVAPRLHAGRPGALEPRLTAPAQGGARDPSRPGAGDQPLAGLARHARGQAGDEPTQRGAGGPPEEHLLEPVGEGRVRRAVAGLVAGFRLTVLHVPVVIGRALPSRGGGLRQGDHRAARQERRRGEGGDPGERRPHYWRGSQSRIGSTWQPAFSSASRTARTIFSEPGVSPWQQMVWTEMSISTPSSVRTLASTAIFTAWAAALAGSVMSEPAIFRDTRVPSTL